MSVSLPRKKILTGAEPPRLLGSLSRWLSFCIIAIVAVVFFVTASEDWLTIVNYTLIFAIATLGLNVLSGYAGQVSLGLAFFMAIGAYTAAWLGGAPPTSVHDPLGLGFPVFIWLPMAGIIAAFVGALVGPTALRLKGFYLGIVSLALIFIGQYIFQNAVALTGGPQGRTFPVPTLGGFSFGDQNTIFGITLTSGQQFFLLIVPVLVLTSLFVGNVMRSRTGRAFQAVRDNEVGAEIMGINLFEAKMGAFILSSFLAGIAGALLASYSRYIVPNFWDLTLSIQFIAAIIVGGIASVRGSLLGAAFVFALPRVIDQFSLLPPSSNSAGISSGDLNTLIYGLLIIVFLLFVPRGIISLLHPSRKQLSTKHTGEGGELAETTDLSTSDAEMQHAIKPSTQGESL